MCCCTAIGWQIWLGLLRFYWLRNILFSHIFFKLGGDFLSWNYIIRVIRIFLKLLTITLGCLALLNRTCHWWCNFNILSWNLICVFFRFFSSRSIIMIASFTIFSCCSCGCLFFFILCRLKFFKGRFPFLIFSCLD